MADEDEWDRLATQKKEDRAPDKEPWDESHVSTRPLNSIKDCQDRSQEERKQSCRFQEEAGEDVLKSTARSAQCVTVPCSCVCITGLHLYSDR